LFSSLLLDDPLLAALAQLGFNEITPVQKAAIPKALEGKDLIVNARTGSGKTASYLLPLLQQILDNPQTLTQAIILAPTRDLCRQINKHCSLLAEFTDITSTVVIGGEDPKHQIKAIEKYPNIIIATPGRLLEHAKREVINLDAINILVLDEADRMLDMGFSDDVITIASNCSEECQTVLYSASFNEAKFKELTDHVLYEPEIIMVDSTRENNTNIQQQKILADSTEHKLKLCQHIIENQTFSKAIIFANKKETVNQITTWLQSKDIVSAVIHGDIEQTIRNQQLRKFRNGDVKIIIATDVASRGLDIPELDLIINFDVARNGEDYMHRIGRTGRMYETGLAMSLVNSHEWNKMISIEHFLDITCEIQKIKPLTGKYNGPENQKSSGKAYGVKRKKVTPKKTPKKKAKIRHRHKKNIGKRRVPSNDISTDGMASNKSTIDKTTTNKTSESK
jgi:superfamily II DNA/RNA helicase